MRIYMQVPPIWLVQLHEILGSESILFDLSRTFEIICILVTKYLCLFLIVRAGMKVLSFEEKKQKVWIVNAVT